jgi:hypothetical protein
VDSPITLLPPDADATTDDDTRALLEIDAAIMLVADGQATRVRLTGIPFIARAAGLGAAHAQVAGVQFRVEGADRAGVLTVTVGPRE